MRRVVLLLSLAACGKSAPAKQLDLDLIRVTQARLRTDTVGEGRFESRATFVLVDAENVAKEGAYVSLGGELEDASKAKVSDLNTQSLWIAPGETVTFALVDTERKPRPTAAAAQIKVRGALVPTTPPRVHVDQFKEYDDYGKAVVQGRLVNDSDRPGEVMVLASFHDERGEPMTRPFTMVKIAPHGTQPLQFVGPQGSKHGTIFCGDAIF